MKNAMKRFLSFALVILMVFSMIPQITIGAKAADTMTIYFENNWNWPDAKIYWWGSTTGTNPAWNGVSMTYVDTTDAGYDRYKVEVPADITGMLFNGTGGYGAEQSADITSGWYDGICYYMTYDSATDTKPAGSYKYESLVTPTVTPTTAATEAPAASNVTVYCINSAKWNAVSAYAWDASGSPAVAWPGAAMTKTDESVNGFDVYSATFDAKYVNVIFNNNNNGSQTADLTVQNGKYYDVKAGAWYDSLSDVPAVDTSSTDVYLVGEFNSWSTVANEFKYAEEGATTGKVALELAAETTYEFKVIKSGSWTSCSTAITETVSGLTFSASVSDNAKITTTEAGTYTFEYDVASAKLSVTYPEVVTDPVYYTVTFVDGDPTYTNEDVEAGGTAKKPADPTKEGYTFGGWYTDETYTEEYDFSTPVTADITLYAKWTEATTEPSDPAEPETITVYFRNDWYWTNVSVHHWGSAAIAGTDWPGMAMTLCDNDGTYDIYSAVIPADATGIVFTGNKDTDPTALDQSPDITDFADGNAYYMHWDGENKCSTFDYTPSTGGGEEEPTENVSYEATFHFINTQNWSVVNLYTWIGSGTQLSGSWPGTATVEKNGYYTGTVTYEAPANTNLNFIFNNGSAQTLDLTLSADAFTENDEGVYVAEKYVALTTQADGKYNAAIVDSPESIVTSPVVDGNSVTFNYGDNSAAAVSVAGSFNDWSDSATPMTKNDEGIWTVTVNDLAAGDYQYKFVVDGVWTTDPMNGNVVTEADGNQNSVFYILSDENTEDDNKVTINIHYTRDDGDYDGWNLWVWGSALGGHQVDFTETDDDGAVVATIVLENAREHQSISFKERLSVEGNEWKDQGSSDRTIDLSTIVSGTIDYYLPAGTCVFGEDVIRKNKIKSVELDYDNGVIAVTSVQAIANPENALSLIKGEGDEAETIDVTITAVGSKYSLALPEGTVLELSDLYLYKVDYYGDLYTISIDAVYASDKFASEYTYEGEDLGAVISGDTTTFKVWAPTAKAVSVKLYASGTEGTDDLKDTVAMTGGTKDDKGVWTVTVNENLNGTYYTYAVTVDGETVEAVDPYARTTGVNGNRGMVIDLDSTDPDGWSSDSNPNPLTSYTDAVIYELHVRDFSNHESSGMTNKGKYLAFTEEGTTTSGGATTGIDYLDELGVTHVHLLPVYDYGSVDETTCKNFNWGYDPVNYNVPEGSYSTDPYDGAARVSEFKQMVKSLHDHDISVIMDVVYNHVYDAEKFCFNNIVPGYFSRVDSNTSGCGNDTASEREMVRKYIVESVLYWHEEYHIDGFRFDLVGLLDVETINQIVEEVHACCPDVIFYGEGWDMDSTNKEPGTEMAKQGNASKTSGFAYFSDSIRNGIGGSNGTSTGFASGAGNGTSMVTEWLGNPWWINNPQQVIQYASCHDNYTLIDKLVLSTGKSAIDSDIIKMNNLAAAFYMTAQGVPFIHAGEEFLREKLEEDGTTRCENSYNASDYVNNIIWSNLEDETYAANSEYYKGLIAFRAAHPALRYSTATAVQENIQTVTSSANLIVMQVDGYGAGDDDIYVILNANSSAQTVTLPEGEWTININGTKAGTESLGTATGSVSVAGISAMVLTKDDEGKDEAAPVGPSEEKTIYFSNNKHWTTVYAYAWDSDGNVVTGTAWPGIAMTYVETNDYGEDIYSVTLPASESGIAGVIFHNNSDAQTVDIEPGADGIGYYCTDTNSEGKYEVGTYTYRAPSLGSAEDYYLIGYINGADYTGADYKFDENGTVTTTFTADSYVYVVNGDNSETYMTDGYQGAVKSATLMDTSKHTLTGEQWDKLLISGGEEVVITMVKNDDNTITLSVETTAVAFEDKSGVQDGVTLHAWNWSFDNITANMATIAEQGYTAIQTSPIQVMKEATNGTDNTVGSHWWVYYQPVDFVITTDSGNALGTKTDFKEMCAEAEKYGIKVIVDVVANHLGNKEGNDLAEAIPDYLRKDEYWHDITKNITSWTDRYNMTQYCLSGLPDLNTANEDIQGYVLNFLKECVDAGADGFRFDMAKSIETPKDDSTFASDFWPTVVGGIQDYAGGDLYIYGEVLDDAVIAISAYTEYMSVTDNGWGNHMRTLVNGGTAGLVSGFYKSADPSNLVIWAESHDTYATDDASQSSAGVSVENINKTWALVAARADAMGLYLARPESNDQLLGVASVTGWANAEVKAVNEFHNAFVGQSETISNENGVSYVERGTSGVVLVNVSAASPEISVTAKAMADGTYTDQITGSTFAVADGKISGTIGETGIAVVMQTPVVAKIGDAEYDTMAEAIVAAKADETIVLVADAEEASVEMLKGITIDLNGHDLTADYLVAFQNNYVIDSVGGGLLKAPKGFTMLQKDNAYLPIWDAENEGYVFACYSEFHEKIEAVETNKKKYIFLPELDASEYELIGQGAEVSGVTMKVKVTWTAANGMPAEATFVYTDDLMQQFVEYYTTDERKAFTLTLTGTDSVADLAFQVYFESDLGVVYNCG